MDTMNNPRLMRVENEIQHGRMLAEGEAESIWGWGTPAGQMRARRRAEMIVVGAGLQPNMRALEIGCGTGMFTEMFAQSGAHLVAVDLSGELLRKARERGLPQERVQFVEKPFEACDVEGPFDAIIGSSLLHHLDLDAALPRIYQLLKPGGVMSFAEPNMLNPQIMVQKNIPWIKKRMGDSPDETAFVRWGFRARLAKVGFNDIQIAPFDWLHPGTPASLISVVSRIGSLMERVPGLREFAGSLYIRGRRPLD
jgi:2-polyprenyl-3-methyl-5-hydroxy-6-metoxy-1,4-benzoquinol methylase